MTDMWFVVQTQTNAEAKAVRNLARQGFETYLPRYLKIRRHARKVERIAAPLFPRYLFVRIDMASQRWRSIQSTVGVSHLVLNGSDPASVSPQVMRALKAREDQGGFVRLDMQPRLYPGEKVRIMAGAFEDNFGLFEGLSDRDRVSVLLDLLGRKVRVSLDADMVVAA